uniref:Sugar phosphate transporter domain-containing protein n=1 Tax=Globisporangium ultimum (strain ATCC 200006 / CBS 805.95 / DAOM BR144) TaxID=431595 RepID=K3WVY2_GLOUD
MKVLRTISGMLVASALLCAGNLCINASKDHGKIPYISVTVTFLIEVLKLVLCMVAILATNDAAPQHFSFKESLFYAVPSLLYMIDNNLTYVILRFVDPATLSVLWNLKILTTAVLFRFVLKRKLSEIRKIAIVLLLLGVVTSQSDHVKSEKTAANKTPTPMHKADEVDSPEGFMFGIILVLIAVTISSCASVFTEWTFKRKGSCSFLWQNVQLYVYGILFNGFGLLFERSEISANGFFYGYNEWTVAVIVVNCVGGICMGFILKYLDNIACVYSHAIAMMLTMLFSMLFFDFSPSLEFGCGLSVLLISMYLYHHKVDTSSDDSDDSDSSCHPPKERGATASSGHKSTIIENLTTPSLAAGGLHLKKKHYEKVPNDSSDLELGSPLSERPSRDD